MPKVKAIIFDKDGTLFDFGASWGDWAEAVLADFAKLAPEVVGEIAEAMGYDRRLGQFRRDSVVIAGTAQDTAAAITQFLPGEVDIVSLLDAHAQNVRQQPVPGLHDTLVTLSQTYVLGVVTNDSEVPARRHLEAHGIQHHFDFIAGYDSGFGAKPEPGQLLGFCDATGVSPADTVMVGDSLHDLIAGRAAGMATVGVLTGIADTEELTDHADIVLNDIRGIAGWLAKHSSL